MLLTAGTLFLVAGFAFGVRAESANPEPEIRAAYSSIQIP